MKPSVSVYLHYVMTKCLRCAIRRQWAQGTCLILRMDSVSREYFCTRGIYYLDPLLCCISIEKHVSRRDTIGMVLIKQDELGCSQEPATEDSAARWNMTFGLTCAITAATDLGSAKLTRWKCMSSAALSGAEFTLTSPCML